MTMTTLRAPEPVVRGSRPRRRLSLRDGVTALILFGPVAGVLAAIVALFDHGVTTLDLILAAAFYAVTGHGLSAGFHRLFTHRSFKASRPLKLAFAIAGSKAFEGTLNGWVANHRRHHAYTDWPGDPHSPYEYGSGSWSRLRGALHAHCGWLFDGQATDEARWAPDMLRDRDLVMVSRLFPLWCVVSLGLPALIGWAVTGTFAGALGGFIWGGLVRVFLLQQCTFAVNSACHLWGKRPFRTRETDRATNLAPLSIVAMGDNWHNLHHASPRLARHGVDRGQLDSSARLIWLFERLGAATDVRWPDRAALDRLRVTATGPEAVALAVPSEVQPAPG